MTGNKIASERRSGLPERPLTVDDIQAAYARLTGEARVALADDLVVAAGTPGGLADPNVAVFALSLAAEIHENAGDLDAALECAEKAVAADERTSRSFGYARAVRARLLFAVGREEEALSQLRELRPLLMSDPDAVAYLSETLEGAGRAELAMQWLTGAAIKLLDRPDISSQESAQAYLVAIVRHRLREALDQPMDEYDTFAVRMKARLDSALEEEFRPSRNAPCPCGSGLKYKRCHGRED